MKSGHPGLWDISVAGHVLAGTDPIDGALREISEEVGLTVAASDLKFSHIHKGDYGMNKEFIYVYFCHFTHDISRLVLQKEEVEAMKLITPAHLRHELHTFPDRYVPHGDYWTEMITRIEVAQKKLQTSA